MKFFTALLLAASAVIASVSASDDSTRNLQPQILGGTEVPIGQKPYVAGLRTTAYSATFCGGMLITPTRVLTAAHCTSIGYVAVATHYASGLRDGQQLQVLKINRHPKFVKPDDNSDWYDVSILELATPAKNVTPIALLRADPSTLVGEKATTMGWGRMGWKPLKDSSDVLLRSDGPIVSDAACKAAGIAPLDESMFCAGGAKDSGACFGDSGGPLVLERPGGDIAIGIVSWGYPDSCGLEGKPVVFSRISKVLDWIEANAPGVQIV